MVKPTQQLQDQITAFDTVTSPEAEKTCHALILTEISTLLDEVIAFDIFISAKLADEDFSIKNAIRTKDFIKLCSSIEFLSLIIAVIINNKTMTKQECDELLTLIPSKIISYFKELSK